MASEIYAMGALIDPGVTDATVVRMLAYGAQPICGDNPAIKGTWDRLKARGVACVMMPHLMSKYYPRRHADFQNGNRNASPAPDTGTCVSRGTYRACMLSYLKAIDEKKIQGRPAVIAYEPIYGGGRMTIGKGRLGSGGGMYGGWAAEWVSRYGCCERNRYGTIDLSVDDPIGRTDLARDWGQRGIPQQIMDASTHKFDAHLARTIDDMLDVLACGFAGAMSGNVTGGPRNQYGMSRLSQPAGHCEAVVGVFVAQNGEDGVLRQNSWKDQPTGPATLVMANGKEYALPQGCYGVTASDQEKALRGGESWHFEPQEGSEWR
jgi:hypothetical protein